MAGQQVQARLPWARVQDVAHALLLLHLSMCCLPHPAPVVCWAQLQYARMVVCTHGRVQLRLMGARSDGSQP